MDDGGEHRAVLLLGEPGGLASALARRLENTGVAVHAAPSLGDAAVSSLLAERRWRAVAVVTRDDVLALRLTLLSAHVRPDVPLWVTMFDRTITRELGHVAPKVHVISPSEIVASELAGLCEAAAGERVRRRRHGRRIVDDALLLLFRAGAGLLLVLLIDAAIDMIALHEGALDALFSSTRTIATVAGAPGSNTASAWYKAVSVLDVLAAIVLLALFTAALVRRLSRPRLTTLLGPRAAPARGHVVLVGFGQVGFRLAQELRGRGIAVLGVERDAEAPCIRLARAAGIPIAIGRGDDREVLERVGVRRCAAVAAVTSADLVNVSVGLAADDLAPGVPLVLRLGDGEVAAETDSLLHLGSICDAHRTAAQTLAAGLSEEAPAA